MPIKRKTGFFVHTGIFRHIEVEKILPFSTEVEYSSSGVACSSGLRHILSRDGPAALREIHGLVVVRNLVGRNAQKRGAVVCSVDANAEGEIFLADDVSVEFYLESSVADLGSVSKNGGVAGAGERGD